MPYKVRLKGIDGEHFSMTNIQVHFRTPRSDNNIFASSSYDDSYTADLVSIESIHDGNYMMSSTAATRTCMVMLLPDSTVHVNHVDHVDQQASNILKSRTVHHFSEHTTHRQAVIASSASRPAPNAARTALRCTFSVQTKNTHLYINCTSRHTIIDFGPCV